MVTFTQPQSILRERITEVYRIDQDKAVASLLSEIELTLTEREVISQRARELIEKVRLQKSKSSGVDALLHEFSLSSQEGVSLMCLAEAFLRVPDKKVRDLLVKDKVNGLSWKKHIRSENSLFVNATAWAFTLTGKLTADYKEDNLKSTLLRTLNKLGSPFIRKGIDIGMSLLAKQFVTGENITEGLENAKKREVVGYRYSFDMLGEAALNEHDANRYYQSYVNALHEIGRGSKGRGVYDANGISVKLSAIHPRYYREKYDRVMSELYPRLKKLFLLAKKYDIGLSIDAEEANRLELSLDVIEKLAFDPDLDGFRGIGIVVQSYQKRCPPVIDYLVDLAKRSNKRFMVRLVKGAYWDSEIKVSQVEGLEGFPVFTRKAYTDVCYLVCAKKLLQHQEEIYPQFATHNAYTAAAIFEFAQGLDYEFQCLHGMGEALYDQIVGSDNWDKLVRIYAPVGTHETLLAYLVRRLLENGANTSFVNQIMDPNISIEQLTECPIDVARQYHGAGHPFISLPKDIYPGRLNSMGLDLSNETILQELESKINEYGSLYFEVESLLAFDIEERQEKNIVENPSDHSDLLGEVYFLDPKQADKVIEYAVQAQSFWASKSVKERADCLREFADRLEDNMYFFMILAAREAGKTYKNAIAEIREAVDFCRYYANEAEKLSKNDDVSLGTFVTISPWNFPLAIFVGELSAALVMGNTVVAKPAEQTSIIAYYAVRLLYEVGVPRDVLQLTLGDGVVGAALTNNQHISGVIFTGSTEVAKIINKTLSKSGDERVLVAETGGQNAMIVDSSALTEQVSMDVINSAFDSAGQRCSALRVLCLQEEIADKTIGMIKGAMRELKVGNPIYLDTDVGAVIDVEAQKNLLEHIDAIKKTAVSYFSIELSQDLNGTFVPPTMIELRNLDDLKKEVFGPVLHVIRFKLSEFDALIDAINAKGYALTHGIHTRIDRQVEKITRKIKAGNIYVNRNMVGAVVGVQPFGGHGLSGTGPKAGGPFYLQRLSKISPWQSPIELSDKLNEKNQADLIKVSKVLQSMSLDQEVQDYILQHFKELQRANQLLGSEIELPGPTGEYNRLTYDMPDSVLLLGGDLQRLLVVFLNLAFLNTKVLVFKESILVKYKGKLTNLGLVVIDDVNQSQCQNAVACGSISNRMRVNLAQRKGPIVKVVDMSTQFDFFPLYHEISVSNNTTAAGGNASLMALSDHP